MSRTTYLRSISNFTTSLWSLAYNNRLTATEGHGCRRQTELSSTCSSSGSSLLNFQKQRNVKSVHGLVLKAELSDGDLVVLNHVAVGNVKSVHGLVLKAELSNGDLLVVLNHVAHAYLKCSDFDTARRVFDEMPQRDILSWTVMIVGSTESGIFLDGFMFFCDMVDSGILPDKFAAIVQTCIGLDCIELGKMVLAQVVVRGFAADSYVSTSLNMYTKFVKVEDSCRMFNAMTEHNKVSWNAMISGLTSNSLHSETFDQFLRMQKDGITPNLYTLTSQKQSGS